MIQNLNPKNLSKTKKFLIPITISKNPSFWLDNLSNLGFSKISKSSSSLELSYVISQDSLGKEHEAIKIVLSKDQALLEIVSEEKNLTKRSLEGWKLLIHVLALAEPELQSSKIFSELIKVLDESIQLIDANTTVLLAENEKLKEENKELQKKLNLLYSEKETLTKKLMQDSIKISELNSKLNKLLEVPDNIIQDELLEWLISHNGEISISEFCLRYSYPPQRVMENLDKLAKIGKISRID
jgi:regulator of replication initiation timing